jgi:phage/plasmid-like protein (TIGR03299 family)
MHMIDETTGQAAIAYRPVDVKTLDAVSRGYHLTDGTPWHKLGQVIEPGDSADVIRAKAGLNYDVLRAPVQYGVPRMVAGMNVPDLREVKARDVLYRSDTGADLGVVSRKGYKVHQPSEIVSFFAELSSVAGFQIEVAGALNDGKRIWVLAKVADGVSIIGSDKVDPYFLMATSFDGSLATIGQPTAIRAVCHNTVSLALQDGTRRFVLPHRSEWKTDRIRTCFEEIYGSFEQFARNARTLAERELTDVAAKAFVAGLLAKRAPAAQPGQVFDITKTRGFVRIMDLFNGAAIGSNLTGGKTAWQLLNSVTEYVDHERGRNRDTGLNAAWFGDGDSIKTEAQEQLLALA